MVKKKSGNDIQIAKDAIKMLWYGLEKTARDIAFLERRKVEDLKRINGTGVAHIRTDILSFESNPEVSFHFLVYSTLAYNFIDLVISCNRFNEWGHESLGDEIGGMLVFRNKVAAHFAYHYPKGDSHITAINSLSAANPVFSGNRYQVGVWRLSETHFDRKTGCKTEAKTPNWDWCLTSVHQTLKCRISTDERLLHLLEASG